MPLETFNFIDSLNASNPVGATDTKGQGDDHLRGIKTTLLNSFPSIAGAVSLTHTQINNAVIKDEQNQLTTAVVVGSNIAPLELRSAAPGLELYESDQIADEKRWMVRATGGQFALSHLPDSGSTGLKNFMLVTRTGNTTDAVQLEATDLNLVGNVNVLDAGETDSITLSHDGTNGLVTGTLTTDLRVLGLSGAFAVYDPGGTDAIKLSHDGTDALIGAVNAAAYVFEKNGSATVRIGGDGSGDTNTLAIGKGFASASYINFERAGNVDVSIFVDANESLNLSLDHANTLAASSDLLIKHDGAQIAAVIGSTGNVEINGGSLVIEDSSGADNLTLSHDGTNAQYTTNAGAHRIHSASNQVMVIDGTGANGPYVTLTDNGTPFADFGTGAQIGGSFDSNSFGLAARSGLKVQFGAGATATPHLSIETDGSIVTPNSVAGEVGFKGAPHNEQNASYTLVLTDAGKRIYKASGSGDTITIPANSSVAFPVGTIIEIMNDSGFDVSVAITTDTLEELGTGNTGTRTLPDNNKAVIEKVTATLWKYQASV